MNFDVTLAFKERFNRDIDPIKKRNAVDEAAKETIRVIRERTLDGIDLNGRKFAKLKKEYRARKASKKRREKMIARALKQFGGRSTRYKAKGVPDFMRLTGQLLNDISYIVTDVHQNVKNEIQYKYNVFIKKRSARKAKWLASTKGANKYKSYRKASRKFFGLSTKVNYRYKEDKRIKGVFLKELGYQIPTNLRSYV